MNLLNPFRNLLRRALGSDDDLEKAKALPIGHITRRKDGYDWKKVREGKDGWQRGRGQGHEWKPEVKTGGRKSPAQKPTTKLNQTGDPDVHFETFPDQIVHSGPAKYYMQVQVAGGYKKYLNRKAYLKDYPKGPQVGHVLLGPQHPDHKRINPKAFFAKVNGEKYMTKEAFLADHPIPSGEEAKAIMREDRTARAPFKVIADFSNPDWHSSAGEKLNAAQKMFLGILGPYKAYREKIQRTHDKEAYARMGIAWGPEDERMTHDERKAKVHRIRTQSKPLAPKPVTKIDQRGGAPRKGTMVKFQYRGKEMTGKIVDSKSVGAKGQQVKKAVTHFEVEYSTGQVATDLKKPKTKRVWVKADDVMRMKEARKPRAGTEAAQIREDQEKKKLEGKIKKASEKLGAQNDAEFMEAVLNRLGDLSDKQNPYRKLVTSRVWETVNSMKERGMDPYASLNFEQIVTAGLAGVYEAIVDGYDPERSSLTTFLTSDKTRDYIGNAINDVLAVERQQFHRISSDGKLMVMQLKNVMQQLKEETGKNPTMKEIETEWRLQNNKTPHEHVGFDIPKLIQMARSKRVDNLIDNMEGEDINLIDNTAGSILGPEDAYIEAETRQEMNRYLDKLIGPARAAMLKLRFRLDESTKGMGVFGEKSPYYNLPVADVSEFEGKTKVSKNPEVRTYEEIAQIISKMGISLSPRKIQDEIDEATKHIKDAYESGDKYAKQLGDNWLRKSTWMRYKLIEGWMLKSVHPGAETLWTNRWLGRLNHMARVVLLSTEAA